MTVLNRIDIKSGMRAEVIGAESQLMIAFVTADSHSTFDEILRDFYHYVEHNCAFQCELVINGIICAIAK